LSFCFLARSLSCSAGEKEAGKRKKIEKRGVAALEKKEKKKRKHTVYRFYISVLAFSGLGLTRLVVLHVL
tara:strand:+ start:7199 stop:7408 length:210 start_codon:yes stop_codon:yes gene_type:complete